MVEGFPISGGILDSGCSTCGSGISMGSVIPGTIVDGGIISGGMIPGEVISDGVIFDGAIVDGDSHFSSKPCETCGKVHTTVKPVPETDESEEGVPGQINPGTLKPQSPQTYDGKTGETHGEAAGENTPGEVNPGAANPVPPAREPSAINEPEALPGSLPSSPRAIRGSLTPVHPPVGAPRARTTPSSWRTTSPRTASPFSYGGRDDFQTPVREGEAIEPTTLMIPTIPDENDTRHVHWVPEGR